MKKQMDELFDLQKKLSDRINEVHPPEEGEDRKAKKILAWLVELAELAQEERSWKFWSTDKKPRTMVTYDICGTCGGTGTPFGIPDETDIDCWKCGGEGELTKNPLLDEYADVLHFTLDVGLEIDAPKWMDAPLGFETADVTTQFNLMFHKVSSMRVSFPHNERENYQDAFDLLIGLGQMVGFTWEEIVMAYKAKNKINHERQNNSY